MEKKRVIGGVILVGIGLILMGENFGWFDFEAEDIFRLGIPLGVIIVGIWLIIRKRNQEAGMDQQMASIKQVQPIRPVPAAPVPPSTPPPPEAMGPAPILNVSVQGDSGRGAEFRVDSEGIKFNRTRASDAPSSTVPGQLKYSKFIGDLYVAFDNTTIKNVEVSCFLGDIEVNLAGATLSPGLNRLIISNFLGEIRVLVPKGIEHFVHLSNFAGDTEGIGRRSSGVGNRIEHASPAYESATTKLYIAVNSFVGEIRVIAV